jgi:hypothetical protein
LLSWQQEGCLKAIQQRAFRGGFGMNGGSWWQQREVALGSLVILAVCALGCCKGFGFGCCKLTSLQTRKRHSSALHAWLELIRTLEF